MKITFLIILFIVCSIVAQSKISRIDSTKILSGKDTLRQIKIYDQIDSITRQPILELKTIITSEYFKVDRTKGFWRFISLDENFTREEIASGLSKNQLSAYKRNKDMFREILQDKYSESWWYRVKGIDELLGIPREVIQILQFAVLLF